MRDKFPIVWYSRSVISLEDHRGRDGVSELAGRVKVDDPLGFSKYEQRVHGAALTATRT